MDTRAPKLKVFVTVGMGRWPFDRLIAATDELVADHDVFVQTGTSSIRPGCEHAPFIDADEFRRRLEAADVVVTHGGNTVRVAQRLGKAPIVIAREAARGEMGNDHQVRAVQAERHGTPMVVLDGDLAALARTVNEHPDVEPTLRAERTVPPPACPDVVRERLRAVELDAGQSSSSTAGGAHPLETHPKRRLSWAYSQLAVLDGRHLDLGCGHGELVDALARHTDRQIVGADPAADKLETDLTDTASLVQIGGRDPLPFADETFSSVSMLDSLEHVWDERSVLGEVHRVLEPGGTLVVTVPRRHGLSMLDPDNAKFRFPRIHRFAYTARFGRSRYEERFVDIANGMRGDLAVERTEHENYDAADLVQRIESCGFRTHALDAANLLWRFVDIPRLFLPDRLAHLTDRPLRVDGRLFHQANLFLAATKC